jgi:hypothetical protein
MDWRRGVSRVIFGVFHFALESHVASMDNTAQAQVTRNRCKVAI